MAFVPLMIRWGADASSDRLRQAARCTRCGGKGAMLMHPSYVDRIVGFQTFPAERLPDAAQVSRQLSGSPVGAAYRRSLMTVFSAIVVLSR